jgi:DNA-binding IclR family transcriptional regulator
MQIAPKAQPVNALIRGLEILSCFNRPRQELTVSEIARSVGLSQPTAWRMCQTLLDQGYLVRAESSKGLRIGAPALNLGYLAIAGLSFPEIALPYMREISAETLGTTSLNRRHAGEIVSLHQVDGVYVRPNAPIGWRAPLPSVASGLAVLAALPEDARAAAMAAFGDSGERKERRRRRVEDALESYGRTGYVSIAHSLGADYTTVAVPLFADGTAPAEQWALSCGGIGERWSEEFLFTAGEALKRARGLLQPALIPACSQAPATLQPVNR